MADISKIILPNGDNYDLKVYTDHIAPMLSKTYTDVIGTANNWANAVFFYGKILPVSYYAVWRIHYRIYVEAAGRDDSKAIADVTITGTQSAMSAYSSFNTIANTSYRPAYYNELYRATSSGVTDNYGHLLGVRLYSSWNPATAANARTITIDILSTENCTFEFFDDMTKYANVPGTGGTNYSAYTELDWTANGLQETGDLNSVDRLIMSSTQLIAGSGGIMQYALIMQDGSDTWQSFTVTNGTATTKTKNTVGFKPGKLYYASTSSNISSGNTIGAVYWSIPFDSRYSLNAGSTLTNHRPLYIVFTYGNDGLLYLEDTWWTQDLPTTQDNKYYMFVGYVYGSGYSTWLAPEHPIYKYVDGKVVEWKFDTYVTHAEDAGTVNGHAVLSDVPSNAVFTDTITAVKGNAESSYRTGNVNLTPENIGAYKVGKEVSHRNTDAISKDPTYAELTAQKNALDYQILRSVAGVGDWFYSAYLNPDFTLTSNYDGKTGEKGNFSISTLFIPSASSTVSIDVDAIAETPFVLTVEKTSSGNITATDVAHLELWDHTLVDAGGRLTDYKVELLTTGSTSQSGEYTWQTVYERHNVSDKVNGLCITLNPTSYSYLYFRGIRFTIEGATGPTNTAAWNYNCITMSLFRLMDQRPAFSAARAMGALDIHGGEVFGNVKVDGTFQGNGSGITDLNGSNISSGTVPVARGGTGQTTSTAAANAFVNALGAQFTTPQDADYFISQSVGGGSTTTTYHRRPMTALWEYVKSKISSVLGLTSSAYGGSAAKVNNHTVQSDVPENAVFTDTTYTGTSPITVSGTAISHANSGVTAASKGDTANQTPTWGDTFKVLSGTVNATGHLTEFAEHTVTIPTTLASANGPGLMSAADKGVLANLDTRLSDVEDTLANIDLSDPDAAIYALALRVAALESHALLDDGYPNIITPAVSFDSTDNSLSIS